MSVEPDADSDGCPSRPDPLGVEYDALPVKLKARDTWVCWRYEWKPDREEWSKVPVNPHSGRRAKANDSETWGTFDTARAYHENTDTDSDGLGFMFAPEDTIAGVDIDDARDPKSGRPTDTAKDIVQRLDSFTEVSPSGTGYHVYVVGILPDGGNRRDGVEMYDEKRFFTVTGHHVDTTPATVDQRNDTLQQVHQEYVVDSGHRDGADGRENTASGSADTSDVSDEEIIEKAMSGKYGDEFRALWRGDTSGYDSHSEADYHLCRHLLFWTGGDRNRTERLFSQSGLTREKWDTREDYRKRTIKTADKNVSSYYDPSKGNEQGPGHATPPEWVGDTDSRDYLSPREVADWAGVERGEDETLADAIADITDREKAAIVWELLKRSDEYHVRVHRQNGELYGYNQGVWTPTGERALRHAGRKALGSTNYGSNVLTELESQAKADIVAEVDGDTLGLEPGVVAVNNGLLNLEAAANGESDARRPLEPEDYALTKLPVDYNPDATADDWREFVNEVVESDKVDAFQEYVGYTLHRGEIPINRALLLVGDGANGKSTALNTVRAMLGEANTRSKAIHEFEKSNHIADLHGAIANIHADLSEGALSAKGISKFKGLTGGDTMEGRRLYQESFEFQPTAKHLYAANTTPDVNNYVDNEDSAWWRRWLVIHFPNYFPPSERDPTLETRLTTDESLSGVLNWAIEGWHRLMNHGRFTDEDLEGATRKRWVTWGENVDHFIEQCVKPDPDAENLSTGEAWKVYTAWCEETGEQPTGQQNFTTTLRDAPVNVGYKQSVRPHGSGSPTRGYKELGFTDDAPDLETVLNDDDTDSDSTDTRGTGLDRFEGDE